MRTDILDREFEIRQWICQSLTKTEISKRLQCKQQTLNQYLKKMNIDYKGQRNQKGVRKGNSYRSALSYIENKSNISSSKLRDKLLKDGIKERKCERCGRTKWGKSPIPLELHHKNGDHYDNTLSNLEILCPNCHALIPNHSKKKSEGQNDISINNNHRKTLRPKSYNIFKQEMDKLNWNYCAMGRKYGVSDNAVRKWEKYFKKNMNQQPS